MSEPVVNLVDLLSDSLSGEARIRKNAEEVLESVCKQNFGEYLSLLCAELADESRDPSIRASAGLAIKNSMSSTDEKKKKEQKGRWFSLGENERNGVKYSVTKCLSDSNAIVTRSAARILARIVISEIDTDLWTPILTYLVGAFRNKTNVPFLRRSSMECICYILEEKSISKFLVGHIAEIINTIVLGIGDDLDDEMKKVSLDAFFNAIPLILEIFSVEENRNIIMELICNSTQSSIEDIAVVAFECLVEIVANYYIYMEKYMSCGLLNITIEEMKNSNENIALQAIEFWSEICYLENEIRKAIVNNKEPEASLLNFAQRAGPGAIPILLDLLKEQPQEDEDVDYWCTSKAAANCLSLFSKCIGNDVITENSQVIAFINNNICSSSWNHREAAVMAFCSILEGPDPDMVCGYVKQALPVVSNMINDECMLVRDSIAWTVLNIVEVLYEYLDEDEISTLFGVFSIGLDSVPSIVNHCSHSISIISEILMGNRSVVEKTNIFSSRFQEFLEKLIRVHEREVDNKLNVQSTVFNAICDLVLCSAEDCMEIVIDMFKKCVYYMKKTFEITDINREYKERVVGMRSYYLGIIRAVVRRIGDSGSYSLRAYADDIFDIIGHVFSDDSDFKDFSVYEDAFTTLGCMINGYPVDDALESEEFLANTFDFVYSRIVLSLENYSEASLCISAVGVVGDYFRVINKSLSRYKMDKVNQIMSCILFVFYQEESGLDVKAAIISVFGDMCISIPEIILPNMEIIMSNIIRFYNISVENSKNEVISQDGLIEDKGKIIVTYTCIVSGLKSIGKEQQMKPYVHGILNIIMGGMCNNSLDDYCMKNCVILISDLLEVCGVSVAELFSNGWVTTMIPKYIRHEYSEQTLLLYDALVDRVSAMLQGQM